MVKLIHIYIYTKLKLSRYRPVLAQRVGRGTAQLFHDRGTRWGWVVSNTPRPLFTPRKEPVPIVQEAGWAPGPVWTGGKSLPQRDSIPDRPARSSVTIPTKLPDPHYYIYIYVCVCLCVLVHIISNEQQKCTDAHKNKSSGHFETRYLMFRRSVVSLSGGGSWFNLTAVHVRFKVQKVTMWHVSSTTLCVLCQYRSNSAPYSSSS